MIIYDLVKKHLVKQEKADLVTTPKTFPLATCPPGPPGPPPPTELEVSGKDSDLEIVGKDPDTLNSESNENLAPSPDMPPPSSLRGSCYPCSTASGCS